MRYDTSTKVNTKYYSFSCVLSEANQFGKLILFWRYCTQFWHVLHYMYANRDQFAHSWQCLVPTYITTAYTAFPHFKCIALPILSSHQVPSCKSATKCLVSLQHLDQFQLTHKTFVAYEHICIKTWSALVETTCT